MAGGGPSPMYAALIESSFPVNESRRAYHCALNLSSFWITSRDIHSSQNIRTRSPGPFRYEHCV